MTFANFELVTAIFIFVVIIFCLIGLCYSLFITFCQGTSDSNFCCNIRRNSPTDDSNAIQDVLYIPARSKGSTDDKSEESNSNDGNDDTECENKTKSSTNFFISIEESNYT